MHAFEPFAAPSGEQEAHVNVIAKPEGKGDMPAIPEITNISRKERPVKVFRSVDAKQITDADGKSAVSGEVEEQIETEGIHVTDQRTEAITVPSRLEPVLFDQRSEDELIEQAAKKVLHRGVEISQELNAASCLSPVGSEPAITIDRAGGNRRKEKQKHEQIDGPGPRDNGVPQAKHDVKRAKRDVRNP